MLKILILEEVGGQYIKLYKNSIEEVILPKREYAILSSIVNSDSNIKPGINLVETTNITEIAGINTKEFKKAYKYVDALGGTVNDWSKRAGKIESDKYIFDIHWVQGTNGVMTEWKIKNKKLKEGIINESKIYW